MKQCYKCGYEWDARRKKPKACPRCKTRLDYVFKETIKQPKEDQKMKCSKPGCDEEAKYIIDGQSLCQNHKHDQEDTDEGNKQKTQGEILSGM